MNVVGMSEFLSEDKIPHSNFLKKEISGNTSPMLHQSILAATAIRKNMLKPKKSLHMNQGLTMQALTH